MCTVAVKTFLEYQNNVNIPSQNEIDRREGPSRWEPGAIESLEWVRLHTALHASPAARTSTHLGCLIFTLPVHSTFFFFSPKLLGTEKGTCHKQWIRNVLGVELEMNGIALIRQLWLINQFSVSVCLCRQNSPDCSLLVPLTYRTCIDVTYQNFLTVRCMHIHGRLHVTLMCVYYVTVVVDWVFNIKYPSICITIGSL